MLGGGWDLPHHHKVCRSQSEQELQCLCVGGAEGRRLLSPGPSRAIGSTSRKDDKTQGLAGRPFSERGMCRGELDFAH